MAVAHRIDVNGNPGGTASGRKASAATARKKFATAFIDANRRDYAAILAELRDTSAAEMKRVQEASKGNPPNHALARSYYAAAAITFEYISTILADRYESKMAVECARLCRLESGKHDEKAAALEESMMARKADIIGKNTLLTLSYLGRFEMRLMRDEGSEKTECLKPSGKTPIELALALRGQALESLHRAANRSNEAIAFRLYKNGLSETELTYALLATIKEFLEDRLMHNGAPSIKTIEFVVSSGEAKRVKQVLVKKCSGAPPAQS